MTPGQKKREEKLQYGNFFLKSYIDKSKIFLRQLSDFEEIFEIKRVYTHPLYNADQQYNDIVVIELGRRVEFDFTKYGHTPTCLDRGDQELAGNTGTVQVKNGT